MLYVADDQIFGAFHHVFQGLSLKRWNAGLWPLQVGQRWQSQEDMEKASAGGPVGREWNGGEVLLVGRASLKGGQALEEASHATFQVQRPVTDQETEATQNKPQ